MEISIGIAMSVIGLLIEFWLKQLLWILIFPPPLGRQVLEALPVIFLVFGGALIVDVVYRSAREGLGPL